MSPLVATEFTTRGQSPMQASIYFASITVVLLKIKENLHFEYVKGKHSFQFEAKQRSKGTTFNPVYSARSLPR